MSELTLIQLCIITISCSIIPRSILSSLKIIEMYSKIKKKTLSSEGSSLIVKELCYQELGLIFMPIISLVLISQYIQINPEYYSELSNEFKILSIIIFGSWCLFEITMTLKLIQRLKEIINPQKTILSIAERSVGGAMKVALKVHAGPKKAVMKAVKLGVVSLTQKKLAEKEEAEPSAASRVALKAVNVAENILTLPEKLIDKGMQVRNDYLENKPKSLGTYPERSVKTTLLLICWSIFPVAYIVLLSYVL